MIEFTKAFKTSDGETHSTLEDAKRHELTCLFAAEPGAHPLEVVEQIVATIHRESDRIVDILSTNGRSRPKARKINKKKATPNENHTKP